MGNNPMCVFTSHGNHRREPVYSFFSFYLFVLCHFELLLTLLPFVPFTLSSIYSESYKTMLYTEVCNKKVMIWSRCASKSYWHRKS